MVSVHPAAVGRRQLARKSAQVNAHSSRVVTVRRHHVFGEHVYLGGCMSGYGSLRGMTRSLFDDLRTVAVTRGAPLVVERLDAAAMRLADDVLTVVICGEFKRGKSSLLNAVLDEREPLFPVDARIATSVVTIVSWAANEEVVVDVLGLDGRVTRRGIDRAQISSYATEAGRRADETVLTVRIGTPHPMLAAGLVLVDTPGVGGTFTAHTAATMAFLPSADAIVFVADFTQPILRSELEFLRVAADAGRTVSDDDDATVFVMTKSDLVGSVEQAELLENAAVKIGAATGRSPTAVTIVAVSSLAKAEYLEDNDPADLAASNFSLLEARLWSTVTRRRAKVHLAGALTELKIAAEALLRPLDDELAGLTAATDRQMSELATQSADRRRHLDRLELEGAEWRSELRDELAVVGRALHREAGRLLDEVWARCDAVYLPDAVRLADPVALSGRLQGDLVLVGATLGEMAHRRSGGVLADFAVRRRLRLPDPRIGHLPTADVPPLTVPTERKPLSRLEAGVDAFNSGIERSRPVIEMVSGLVGSLVPVGGELVGKVLEGVVGTVFAVLGTVGAVKGEAVADRAKEEAHLRAELEKVRVRHADGLAASLDDLVEEMVRTISGDLDSRIAQEIETVDDSLRRLAAARDRTESESEHRRAEIDGERAPLQRVLTSIDTLAADVLELTSR